ncbi:MAG: YfhO family protein [Deltaproteobacteria bacterium]|nr:YfhO family protein [Deltaproteobacteria bacterium]
MQLTRDPVGGDERSRFPVRGLTLVVVAIVAVWWWRVWTASGSRIDPAMNFDAPFYWMPLLQEAARQWRSGSVPLWNPYQALGTPLLATLQVGALYPLNVLYLWLAPSHAWLCTAMLHQALGSFGLFALCRQLKLSRAAAFVGACALGSSWLLLLKVYDQPQYITLAWVPVELACAEHVLVRPSLRSTLMLAVVCALQVLAGHPGTIAYSALLLVVYVVARSLMTARDARRRAVWAVLAAGAAAILAVGLTAVQWLPTHELVERSVRATGALTVGQQTLGTADPYRIFSGAPGTVMLALALYGAVAWRRRGPAWFFACTSLALVLFAIAPGTALFQQARNLPGGSWFRAWNRVLVLWPVCMAVLTAAGAEALSRPATDSGRRRWVVVLCCLGVAVSLRLLLTQGDQVLRSIGLALAFDIVPIGAVALLSPLGSDRQPSSMRRLHPSVILALCTPAAALVPTTIAEHLSIRSFAALYEPYAPLFDKLRSASPARTLSLVSVANGHVWAKLGTYFEVPVVNDLEPLSQSEFQTFRIALSGHNPWWFAAVFMGEVAPPERRFDARWLDLSGVRFVVADRDSAPQLATWFAPPLRSLADVPAAGNAVFENPNALPRSFFVPEDRARIAPVDCVAAVQDSGFDPARDLFVDRLNPTSPLQPVTTAVNVEIIGYQPVEVQLRVDAPQPGFVVLTDAFFPGWRADVDGSETEILQADCFFRALHVARGAHTVRLRYVPDSFRNGMLISLATLAAVVVAGIGGLARFSHRVPWRGREDARRSRPHGLRPTQT